MKDLYIIKLGGSVITEKDGNRFEAKKETIARIALEIKKAMGEKKFSLIVVHGVGPFGHTNVMEYGINEGIFTERQKEGLEKTIKDCNFLDSIVVEELGKAGIKAVAFDPNRFVEQENKKIIKFPTKKIEKALKENMVPVIFGQMVPDKKLNASVMSGDAALALLAKKIKPKMVLVGTDVSGIFTADPKKFPNAERIGLIGKKNFGKVIEMVSGSNAIDVTGGMKGKLEKLREQLKGTIAIIFNANEKGSFYKALKGEKVQGTTVRL